jgi:hypothetical protein
MNSAEAAPKLSVVVVCYEMGRANREHASLSASAVSAEHRDERRSGNYCGENDVAPKQSARKMHTTNEK